jgi:predicted metal-dependent phosphoesterase TrpH
VTGGHAYVDLHCHTSASFDSLASPASVVRAAVARGLTHLAITDHERISGALAAREHALAAREHAVAQGAGEPGLTIIVGEEIRSRDGDLVAVFLTESIPPGLSAAETIAAVRDQGGLVGIPHPYDRSRGGSMRRAGGPALETLAGSVDWIEAWNGRVLIGNANQHAAELAAATGIPGIASSDAHTSLEVGIASTVLDGDLSTAAGLLAALAGPRQLVFGRASAYVRLVTPVAKVVQRFRGNGRLAPPTSPTTPASPGSGR